MNILLVEDDADMSKALLRALEKRNFRVTPCYDGANALRLIKDGVGDLVILDLNIPGLDGLHLLQRIRSQGIDIPVIVLTARGAVGDRVAGLNAGADDYLPKPFDLEELDARIRALLRRKGGGEDLLAYRTGRSDWHDVRSEDLNIAVKELADPGPGCKL